MNVQLLIGSTLETLSLLLVGYGLINLSTRKHFISFLTISILVGVLLLPLKESFSAPIYLLVCIGILILFSTIILRMSVVISFLGLLLGALCLLVSELISLSILSVFIDVKAYLDSHRLAVAIPHFIVMICIYILIRKHNIYIFDATKKTESNEFSTYINLSAALLMLQFFALYLFFHKTTDNPFNTFLSLFSVGVVISILWLIKTILAMISDKYEAELDKNLQQEVITHFQEVKSQRHDFIFHLNAIYGLLYAKDYIECEAYVKSVVKDVNTMNESLPVFHPAVSALLISLKESAAIKGINVKLDIRNDLSSVPLKVYEINRILGNLIRNAIDEVETAVKIKQVQVIIYSTSEDIVIEVQNHIRTGTESTIERMFEDGHTTKKAPNHQGIGLTVVTQIAEKYGGFVFPELAEDTLSMKVNIPKGI